LIGILLLAASALAPTPSVAPVRPTQVPDASAADLRAPSPPPQPSWPSTPPGPVSSAPDWGDYRIYPEAARRKDAEGRVRFEVLVDDRGTVEDCRLLQSSGSDDLDQGTCRLARTMRFAPGEHDGKPVPSSRAFTIRWLLDVERPLSESMALVRLKLAAGALVDCDTQSSGMVGEVWSATACAALRDRERWLGARGLAASGGRVELHLSAGTLTAAPVRGTADLAQRITFAVNADGDAVDCSVTSVRISGAGLVAEPGICPLFLRQIWFQGATAHAPHPTGTLDVRVTLDE
jgi:TonB family protein